MMSIIHPVMMSGLARDSNGTYNLTVYGAAFSIIVLLESPIIMILHTANALAENKARFRRVRTYMFLLSLLSLGLLIILGFTEPGQFILRDLMGLSVELAHDTAQLLRLFIFWPVLVGWRRLCQGTLIRLKKTSVVGAGTMCRAVVVVVLMITYLQATGGLDLYTAVLILILSMSVETLIVTVFVLANLYSRVLPENPEEKLSLRDVHTFYVPLFLTTVVMVVTRPVLIAGLARLPNPEVAIASWSIIYSVTILFSNHGRGFINLVITLGSDHTSWARIGRFGFVVGGFSSALLIIISTTPPGTWFLGVVMGIEDRLIDPVRIGLFVTGFVPFLRVFQNRARGALIRVGATRMVNLIALANVATMCVGALLIAVFQLPGVLAASLVFLLAYIGEVLILQWTVQRQQFVTLFS